jgi:broad specificity phosphatase PhoE
MTISLIRNGRPMVDYRTRISGTAFAAWLDAYDAADVDASLPPSRELREAVSNCGLVVTSNQRRSTQSADLLGLSARRIVIEDAAEAPLPRGSFSPLPMKPLALTVVARILWNLGIAGAAESRSEAVARGQRFAARLEALASEAGHIAVVGHGYFNRFTAAALERSGWYRAKGNRGYWSLCQLQKPA